MKHLTEEEVLGVVESMDRVGAVREPPLPPHRHLQECPQCRARVEDFSRVLDAVASDEVPEPSPLFWDHFSERVSRAVSAEATPARRAPWWRSQPVLWPLAAGAVVLLVLLAIGHRPPAAPAPQQARAGVGAQPARPPSADVQVAPVHAAAGDEESWQVLSAIVAETDAGAAALAPSSPGSADTAAQQLSDEERAELERLLRAEMARHGGRVAG